MITLHRISGQEFTLNSDHIESLESTPDTVVLLMSGRKLVVKEGVDEIVRRVIAFRQQCGSQVHVVTPPGSADRE